MGDGNSLTGLSATCIGALRRSAFGVLEETAFSDHEVIPHNIQPTLCIHAESPAQNMQRLWSEVGGSRLGWKRIEKIINKQE
jgi:hypothetical protein